MNDLPASAPTGYLVVRVSTAGGAIPLENAVVVIRGNTPEASGVLYTERTDRDGKTRKIPLPTPPSGASEAPGNSTPYATYNIDVSRSGYYANTYQNVPVFDRITAIQSAELIPLTASGMGSNRIPNDTRFYESENPDL